MEPTDGDLWARSRLGDRDGFGELFERHAKLIYNYCFRRVGSWATAEDLLSIVFVEAWRRRDMKLPPDKVLPWLYGIATNVVRNQRRSERRHLAALARMPVAYAEADSFEASEQQIDDQQQAQRALALLRKLPGREQDVFFLCAVRSSTTRTLRCRSVCRSAPCAGRHRALLALARPHATAGTRPGLRT